jgi:protein-tyrosine-phosphatase/DNA-binding transcriptional ArsR family regulator
MTAEGNRLTRRAAVHAALGDPGRLAIVDALVLGEASPSELQHLLDMPSNLLAHHVRVLEKAGVVARHRSEGDRRRTYLSLVPGALGSLRPVADRDAVRVVFVCTGNSARSQLAAAMWSGESPVPATSAGTHPAPAVHPGAIAAARRRRIALAPATPRHVADVLGPDDVVITVCDSAHEELGVGPGRLHWSIPDPARGGDDAAFDRAVDALADRITRVAPAIRSDTRGGRMSITSRRDDLSIDQQLALRTAATNLAREFDGTFGSETIERFLYSSYDEFADRAAVLNFLPLLAERFARQRLRALARVEGKAEAGTPVVLFLCTHNAGRSQMAMGLFTQLAGDGAVAWSGGSEPGTRINPAAVEAMAERGIDISGEYPKPWTDEIVRAADVVVTMGCGDACPVFPGRRYLDWQLDDPAGQDVAAVRPIRDDIERRVRTLLAELGVPVD